MIGVFAAALSLSCAPIPGLDQVWANPKVRTVVIGEEHGSTEAPALFADIVCHAAQRGPVTVALEQPETIQRQLEAYVETGTSGDRDALLRTPAWTAKFKDGRTSEAMLRLFVRLHDLRAAGADISIAATMPARPSASQNYYEVMMASAWAQATRPPPRLVLALVGNLHARKTDVPLEQGAIRPAASHLPPNETLTLNIVGGGGSMWNCIAVDDCKARTSPLRPAPPRGVVLGRTDDGAYDGVASTGGAWTASPPAVP
jgi:hypothetical protein